MTPTTTKRRRRRSHEPHYRGWRPLRITVACRCGWVSEHHRSRGEAKRSYDGHVWLTRSSGKVTA